MKNSWVTRERQLLFDNDWMAVLEDRVLRPNGSDGLYAWIHFKNVAVCILPLHEDDTVSLVGQWRYTLGSYSWELPAGGCHIERGETPLATAHRELAEETGLRAGRMLPLGTGHLSNSITDEATAMFVARDLEPLPARPPADASEDLRVARVPYAGLLERIDEGEITDALTLVTVLRYELARPSSDPRR